VPRPKLETSFLGEQTVAILLGVPQKQAGWLIHALCDWIVNDREPDRDKIPAACIGSWIAIHDESVRIHNVLADYREKGERGGRQRAENRTESEREANGKQMASKRQAKGNKDEDEDIDISSDVDVGARAPARETAADIGTSDIGTSDIGFLPENHHRTSDIGADATETPESRIRAVSWRAWAERLRDPVEAALDTTGETTAAARRTYGKRLKELGRARFLDTVESFAASLAEEPVRNRGAALTKQLGEAVAARRAMEALK
jgi:hypothetical protein